VTEQTSLETLLVEYDRALGYTDALWVDLDPDEIVWRPNEQSSAIGWHLAHQAAVGHFMLRNLTAAQPRLDPELESLADSATAEIDRGDLPDPARISALRSGVAEAVHSGVSTIAAGDVGAPAQLSFIAQTLLIAVINHEYQHSKWIGEVRTGPLGHNLPPDPESEHLAVIDGYHVIGS